MISRGFDLMKIVELTTIVMNMFIILLILQKTVLVGTKHILIRSELFIKILITIISDLFAVELSKEVIRMKLNFEEFVFFLSNRYLNILVALGEKIRPCEVISGHENVLRNDLPYDKI